MLYKLIPMQGQIKTTEEIELIAEGGKLLRGILYRTADLVKAGVTTKTLSDFADKEIRKIGGRPSFIGYGDKHNQFPAALCTSVNDVVVHGVPGKVVLAEGDIVVRSDCPRPCPLMLTLAVSVSFKDRVCTGV